MMDKEEKVNKCEECYYFDIKVDLAHEHAYKHIPNYVEQVDFQQCNNGKRGIISKVSYNRYSNRDNKENHTITNYGKYDGICYCEPQPVGRDKNDIACRYKKSRSNNE